MSDTSITPLITEAEALQVISRGVSRAERTEAQRTLSYVTDACKLRGHNVRKLAQKLEIRAEEKGERFNADSYMSNVSNANGIMGLFEYDLDAFKVWLEEEAESKSLSAIYKAFRKLFADPKPSNKRKAQKGADAGAGEGSEKDVPHVPLIDQMIANLVHLTPEERVRLIEAAFQMDNGDDAGEAEAEAA